MISIDGKDNLLIICPTGYKNKMLEEFSSEKKMVNAKFMSLSEYKRNYFYDYDIADIKYLKDKYNLSPKNAKEILNNLLYVEDKKYDIEKLDLLVKYKRELEDNKLLIKNDIFKDYLNNKNVLVVGYGRLSDLDKSIIKGKTVEIIVDEEINRNYLINEFDDIEEEVEYLYNSIFDLLKKGVDINSIYILNNSDIYSSYFKRFNSYYDFKVDVKEGVEVIGTTLGQKFISMLEDTSREDIYAYLTSINDDLSLSLINLLNKYAAYNTQDIKELIIEDIKSLKITKNFKDVVRCVDFDYMFNDDDHVFLIGFNDKCPNIKKDVEYITNNVRELVNMPSIEEENALIKLNTRTYLSNINNLYISYSCGSPFDDFNKQILFNDKEVSYIKPINSFEYSDLLNKKKYATMLDDLYKFDIKDINIEKLYKVYDRNDYLEYDNSFKGLNTEEIANIKKQVKKVSKNPYLDEDKLTLSYSSMNNFYKCNFRYYLESVIGLKDVDINYFATLGSISHGVLEDYYKSKASFDFDLSWDKQVAKFEKKNNVVPFNLKSEIFFSNKIKEELKKDIEIIKEQNDNSLLDKYDCENNFNYNVNSDINYTGFADKLMYKEKDGKMYASVVDYKTGKSNSIDRKLMDYGLSLQLPSYLYLLKNADNYKGKEIEFIGLYIQHLINYDLKYDAGKSLLDKKNDSMKLDGISSSDINKVSLLDSSLSEGKISSSIAKVYVKKDGELSSRSKNVLYSNKEFEELIDLVDKKVIDAGNSILSGDFSINPKIIKDKNQSCEFCSYAPICYKRLNDFVYIENEVEEQ